MSSQEKGIPLQSNPDGIGYRLIELPPDLLSLLESDNAPVLTLESSDTSALLKAEDKTWALRQKNTSNALIIMQPHIPNSESSKQGLAAISTIHETVELDAVTTPVVRTALKDTGSKGKWHERFGRNR